MDDSTLNDLETRMFFTQDWLAMAGMAQQLLAEVYRLRKELNDPFYMYAYARISRTAILCRNAELEKLKAEIKKLKEALRKLEDDNVN
jgi:cell division protein FtsB